MTGAACCVPVHTLHGTARISRAVCQCARLQVPCLPTSRCVDSSRRRRRRLASSTGLDHVISRRLRAQPWSVSSSRPSLDCSPTPPCTAASAFDHVACTAARRPCSIANSSKRRQLERALFALCRVLVVDICSFPLGCCLSHGNEEHVAPLQPPTMVSQCARQCPVCSPYGRPHGCPCARHDGHGR
jgi:hypothetical protein